ncbi:MAG: thermonuclease family protein, partial [Elusimicrobia bacterium]|nr:thermonuclease family protein [Elusimicrobiota bacterium]
WKRSQEARYDPVSIPQRSTKARVGKLRPPEYKRVLPPSKHQTEEVLAKKRSALLRIAKRYLTSKVRGQQKLKQLLLVGLRTELNALWNRLEASLQGELQDKLEGELEPSGGLGGGLPDLKQIRRIVEGSPQEWDDFEKLWLSWFSPDTQEALIKIRRTWERGISHYSALASERIADLGGLLYWGPHLFGDHVSIIASGPFLWTWEDRRLEIIVVRNDGRGPKVIHPKALSRTIALPALTDLKVVEVGEAWLQEHFAEGDRLLTRAITLGITLRGRDLLNTPPRLHDKIPPQNLVALAEELLNESLEQLPHSTQEATRDRLRLIHLILTAVIPEGTGHQKFSPPDPDSLPNSELLRRVKRRLARTKRWTLQEALRAKVSAAAGGVASASSDSLGGLMAGDWTEGRALHLLSEEESLRQVKTWIDSGTPIDAAAEKFAAALRRARSQSGWFEWFPRRLELDRFVDVGAGPAGRPLQVRVTARRILGEGATPQKFIAYAIAKTRAEEGLLSADRYELVLEDIFQWSPEAQDGVFKNIASELHGLLQGRRLNASLASTEVIEKIGRAVQDARNGFAFRNLPAKATLPWTPVGWEGAYSSEDVLRIAQGLSRFISRHAPQRGARVLLIPSPEIQSSTERAMAEVLAGNEIETGILQRDPAWNGDPAQIREALRNSSFDIAVWMEAERISILAKDGAPLSQGASNEIGFEVLSVQDAKLLDIDAGHKRNLIHSVTPGSLAEPEGEGQDIAPISELASALRQEPEPSALPAQAVPPVSADDGISPLLAVAAEPPPAEKPPNLTARTILAALLAQSFMITIILGQPLLAILHPSTITSYPIFFILYSFIKALIFLRGYFQPSPIFIAWLSMAVPAAAAYFLRDRIHYWMTPEGESDLAPWWAFYRPAWWKRFFIQKSAQGVEAEFDALPKVDKLASRSNGFDPLEELPSGTVAIREKNLAAIKPWVRLLIYLYSAAWHRIVQNRTIAFHLHQGDEIVIARYRLARVLFFVLTAPFWFYRIWVELLKVAVLKLLGRPLSLLVRIQPKLTDRTLELPDSIRDRFNPPEMVRVRTVLDHNLVQLDDGRNVRVYNTGKPGHGAVDLVKAPAKNFLAGRLFWMLAPARREGGTRNMAVHLYIADGPFEERPLNAVDAIAAHLARYAHRHNDPYQYSGIDRDKLPIVLRTQPVAPKQARKNALLLWWSRAVLTAFLGLALASSLYLLQPSLAPLARYAAWALLAAVALPSVYGLYRSTRKFATTGLMRRHPAIATVLLVLFSIEALLLFRPKDAFTQHWAHAPRAERLGRATLKVLDALNILPRPKLPPTAGLPQIAHPENSAAVTGDHPIAQTVRNLADPTQVPYFSDQIEVRGPPELEAGYRFEWAYSPFVTRRNPDGDNIWLAVSRVYGRYLGVNTPETDHGGGFDANEGAQPFGEEAARENRKLVLGHRILVAYKKAGRAQDSFSRSLLFVWAPENPEDPDSRLVLVQWKLLQLGLGNEQYSLTLDDTLLKYRYLNPATDIAYRSTRKPRQPAYQLLDLDPRKARDYYFNQPAPTALAGWELDGDTPVLKTREPLKISGFGKTVTEQRFVLAQTALPADPQKRAQAWRFIQESAPPGTEIRVLVARGHVWNEDKNEPQSNIPAYVYFPSSTPGVYTNLNALVFEEGHNSHERGIPSSNLLKKTHLQESDLNYLELSR